MLNKFIDFLRDIAEYLILLIFIALAVLIILWRFDIMEKESLASSEKNEIQTESSEKLVDYGLEGKEITINIPKDTKAPGIVRILSEYGLIDDTSPLLEKLENLPEEDLPSGDYKIKLGSSEEEVEKELGLD